MMLKIDSKVILALSAAIGTAFVAGAASGITLYKNRKEFREWFDNMFYPAVNQIVKEVGPTVLRFVIVKALENKPQPRKIFLDIVDFLEAGKVKLPKGLEKALYKIKDEFPPILEELEKIQNESK
jgi:hypothetical protein